MKKLMMGLRVWLFFLLLICIFSLITPGQETAAYQWSFGEESGEASGEPQNFQSITAPVPATGSSLTLGGHFESLTLARKLPHDDYQGFTDTQIRFDVAVTFSESFKLAYSQVADLLAGENAQVLNAQSPFDLPNLDAAPINEEDIVVKLHPDRLNVNWESEKFSTTIGRQAIGFGNLLGYSPLDLIAPFFPLALNKDIRPGVDAIKLEYYPKPFKTVTAVAVIPASPRNRSYLLLYTLAGEKGDFNFLLGENQQKTALGLGYSGDLKGMGVRAESLFFGEEHDGSNHGTNSGYAQAGFEVDYRFRNDLYMDFEFFYYGNGAGKPRDYDLYNPQTTFAARYYTILSLSYDLTPILKFSPAAIVNLRDGSMLASPRLVYSISDNSEVLAFIDLAIGQSPAEDGTIRSEYGSAAHGGGLYLRLFF